LRTRSQGGLPTMVLGDGAAVLALLLEGDLAVPEGSAVWVLDEASMTVNLNPVQVATVDGNQVVISGGLQAGQKVVSVGVHVLTPGQKVTVYVDSAAKSVAPTPTGR
jgi:hypothetical protein